MAGKDSDYINMTQAAKSVPGRVSTQTVWRWARRGLRVPGGRRIRLKYIRVGARVLTRREWLTLFFEQLAEADLAPAAVQHPNRDQIRTPPASHQRADTELREAGA